MNVNQAAKFAGVSGAAIRQALLAGRLVGDKINARAWSIAKADIQQFKRDRAAKEKARQKRKAEKLKEACRPPLLPKNRRQERRDKEGKPRRGA